MKSRAALESVTAVLRSMWRRPARAGAFTSELSRMTAVGMVSHRSARIWVRSDRPAPIELRLWPLDDPGAERRVAVCDPLCESCDLTTSFEYPTDFPSEPPLASLRRYGFRLIHSDDGTAIGEGCFETAPGPDQAPPEQFTFAFMSCHQPFKNDGTIDSRALRMLHLIEPTLDANSAKYVLLVGDQMYSDYPRRRSLFNRAFFRSIHDGEERDILDCSEEVIRRYYHQRYRVQWNVPQFASFQRRYPTYCMLDDHEIVDNWGSGSMYEEPRWQKLARAARAAYFDYQGTRTMPRSDGLPPSFHFDFSYGPTATFVTDMRSQRQARKAANRIFGEDQFRALETFLSSNADRRVLFIVLTVPTLYVPDWMASAGVRLMGEGNDISDRWGWRKNTPDRSRLLRTMRRHLERHPHQKLVLLSGDIHLGLALKIRWDDAARTTVYEFVSSAVTNSLDKLEYVAAKIAAHTMPHLHDDGHELFLELLEPAEECQRNPFSGLNMGLVDVKTKGDEEPAVRFRLVTHGKKGTAEGAVAFDSGWL